MDSRTLILGLGNDILSDDGVGLEVVRQLSAKCPDSDTLVFRETMEMGLALLDFMVDFDRVIIVDSIQTGQSAPGTLHEVDVTGWEKLSGSTPHFLGVGETLKLGRQLGLNMPAQVTVVAVEVQDPYTLGTTFSTPVAAAVSGAVHCVERLLRSSATLPSNLPRSTEVASERSGI
jgi:hydrogenase maturation protease